MINTLQEKAISLLLEKGNFSINEVSKALNIDKKIVSELFKKRKMSNKKMTFEDKSKLILDMYNQGKSMRAIQRETRISYDTISKTLKNSNIKIKINRILNQKDKEEIAKLYMSGMLQPEIAEKFQVSVSTIKQVVKKLGAIKFNRIIYPKKYTKKIQNEIIRLYTNGEAGIQKISRDLKVSQTAIRNILSEKNIEINDSQRYREKIDQSTEEKIVELYQSGMGCIPIKNELGISRESVKNILKAHHLYKDWILKNKENSGIIIKLFNKENTIKQISKKTSEKESSIEKFLKANDLIKTEKKYIPEKITKEQYQSIINLYLQGKNMMEISKSLNINYSYIATIIKKTNGLKEEKKGVKGTFDLNNVLKYHPVISSDGGDRDGNHSESKETIKTKVPKIKEKSMFNFSKTQETVELKNSNLTEIPHEISTLKKLKNLNLESNKIKDIPDFIYKLTNLETLNLAGNEISEISKDINKLKNLKFLNLKNNLINALPKEITELSNLENLDISNNPIKKLPSPESFFFNLKKFYIKLV